MTGIEDRPQTLTEAFERIATAAEREDVRMRQRPDLWLSPERGLTLETEPLKDRMR